MLLIAFVFGVVLVRALVARAGLEPVPLASSRRGWLAARVATTAAFAPVLRDLTSLAGPDASLSGDAGSHLAIAQDIASFGLPHDWLGTFNGGFPFAVHYPAMGWVLLSGLLRAGIHPVVAIRGLGLLAHLLVPLTTFVCLRRAGVRPMATALGAIAIGWITPYIQFTGGWEMFLVLGLLSQVVATPLVILWAGALARGGRGSLAPVLAALVAAAHPQLFGVGSLALVVTAIGSGQRPAIWAVLRSVIAGGVVAGALYVPGMRTLHTPFGWPPHLSWRLVGFGPERVLPWLRDGELLDNEHAPVVTWLWLVGLVVHLFEIRRPRSRAVLAASVAVLAMCMSGRLLGQTLLSVAQPMRALALVPIAAVATIATAFDVLAIWIDVLARSAKRPLPQAVVGHSLGALALLLLIDLPPRIAALHALAVEQLVADKTNACLPWISGVDAIAIRAWLSRPGAGRSAYGSERIGACASNQAAELQRTGALAVTRGAGAHVGLHAAAFAALGPRTGGPVDAHRAEALGIRRLVHGATAMPVPQEAWRTVASAGEVRLSERLGGSDLVGVGCVVEVVSGADRLVFDEIFRRVTTTGSSFLDAPGELVALDVGDGPLVLRPAERDGCDAARAIVHEVAREPGALEATLSAEASVDVVFRASAYPGWRVVDDHGASLPVRTIAPGFFSVRVGPGEHHLVAIAALPSGYRAGLAVAGVLFLLWTLLSDTDTRARTFRLLWRASNSWRRP